VTGAAGDLHIAVHLEELNEEFEKLTVEAHEFEERIALNVEALIEGGM